MRQQRSAKLSQFDLQYILERAEALRKDAGNRIARMDRYERMYRMDVWKDPPAENQQRVTLPVAFDTVEKMRALLITRPPQISVPTNSSNPEDQERAQKLERYLYGVMSRCNLPRVIADAEWFAMGLGEGVTKFVYDPHTSDEDFSLVGKACDPRTIFGRRNPSRDRYVEMIETWERTRAEIEDEYDVELPRPAEAYDPLRTAAWLDEKVKYIEYWCETNAWEDIKPKDEGSPFPSVIERAAQLMLGSAAQDAGMPELNDLGDEVALGHPVEEGAEEPPKRLRVRKIVNAVVIEDSTSSDEDGGIVIKKACIVPGYKFIPYITWAGISTPLAGDMSSLSILYPLSNGDGGDGAMGVLAAWSTLASLDLTEALNSTNPPIVSDDPKATISLDPGGVTTVEAGRKVVPLREPGQSPAFQRMSDQMSRMVDRVALPEVLSGQVFSLSGQAISGLASAFQMLIGFKQQERERALEQLFTLALSLTHEYADMDKGWTTFGDDAFGKYRDVTITPDDIGDVYRVRVKLSASMPRDDTAFMALLQNLVNGGLLSRESALDQVQKLIGLASESPIDEIKRILRDRMLLESDMSKQLAQALANEYIPLITGQAGGITPEMMAQSQALAMPQPPQMPPAPPTPPPGMMPNGMVPPGMMPPGAPPGGQPQMPPQMSPTGGLPSSVVAPTPDMLAAIGNLTGAANMQNPGAAEGLSIPGLEGIV